MVDIRWQQRFSNYKKALSQLKKFIEKENLNELEIQGLIKSFEYTFELAWNTIRDYLISQAIQNINGSRDAFREAFKLGIITKGELWMDMIADRNRTSHTYDEKIALQISKNITSVYFTLFHELSKKIESILVLEENE